MDKQRLRRRKYTHHCITPNNPGCNEPNNFADPSIMSGAVVASSVTAIGRVEWFVGQLTVWMWCNFVFFLRILLLSRNGPITFCPGLELVLYRGHRGCVKGVEIDLNNLIVIISHKSRFICYCTFVYCNRSESTFREFDYYVLIFYMSKEVLRPIYFVSWLFWQISQIFRNYLAEFLMCQFPNYIRVALAHQSRERTINETLHGTSVNNIAF